MTLEQKAQELDSQSTQPLPMGKWLPWIEAAINCWDNPHEPASGKNWVFLSPRYRAAATLRGAAVERMIDPNQGARPYKIAPTSFHPAHRALHGVGLSIACKRPVLVVLGQAALANGSFHEALNILSLHNSAVCFLLLEERLTEQAPIGTQFGGNLEALCKVYNLEYISVDSSLDPEEALSSLKETHNSSKIIHLSL